MFLDKAVTVTEDPKARRLIYDAYSALFGLDEARVLTQFLPRLHFPSSMPDLVQDFGSLNLNLSSSAFTLLNIIFTQISDSERLLDYLMEFLTEENDDLISQVITICLDLI